MANDIRMVPVRERRATTSPNYLKLFAGERARRVMIYRLLAEAKNRCEVPATMCSRTILTAIRTTGKV